MNKFLQFIPSFASQRSRLTKEKAEEIRHSVLPEHEILSFNGLPLHEIQKDIILEIGSGYGDTISHLAKQCPEILCIACEVYIDAISSICKKIAENNLDNIKIFANDARIILKNIPNKRLNNLYLLFPDPWPKKKHHKRRIISDIFLQEVARVLKQDGRLFIATDDESYKIWINEVIANQGYMMIENQNQPNWWVKTKFQQKAEEQGREVMFFTLKPLE